MKIVAVRIGNRYGSEYETYLESKLPEYEFVWIREPMADNIKLQWNKMYGMTLNIDEPICVIDIDILLINDYKKIFEYPIKQGQFEKMAQLCELSPIPIVLDEELIGIKSTDKEFVIEKIKPVYIILKPSLQGGFKQSEEWIRLAEKHNVKWWVTSALESNIGLNAIAQWTFTLQSVLPQGLGTGQLYHNNIPSPLEISEAKLYYNPEIKWDFRIIK